MLRNLLFVMSLCGSLIIIFYWILAKVSKQYFPIWWRFLIIGIAMFFYLFPVSLFKYDIGREVHHYGFIQEEKIPFYRHGFDNTFFIIEFDNTFYFSSKVKYIWLISIISGFISLIIISYLVLNYKKTKKLYIKASVNQIPQRYYHQLYSIQKELGIKKKIHLRCSEYFRTPLTIGIYSSTIIIPESSKTIDDESLYFILKHELMHIKYHHSLIKMLGVFITAIHWFNPFSYFLLHELNLICEMECDKKIIQNIDDKQRKKYSSLILFYSADSSVKMNYLINSAGDAKTIKRRFLEMKNNQKRHFVLSLCTALFLTGTGIISSFAYIHPSKLRADEEFSYDAVDISISISNKFEDEERVSVPYDEFYTDDNGINHPIINDQIENRSCLHPNKESITIKSHKKHDDGSCDIKYYNGWKCQNCDYVGRKELYETRHYEKCSH